MSLGLLFVLAGGIFVFVASWSTKGGPSGVLGLLGCIFALVVLGSSSLLVGAPSATLGLIPYVGVGLDPVEVGALGALVGASLPFFAITPTRPLSGLGGVGCAVGISLGAGLIFVSTSSMWVMFAAFEALLLGAIYILLLTSKSERARDAALEMFMWTLVGSVGLLTGLGLVGSQDLSTAAPARWGLAPTLCFLLGFGVKVPLWPATAWLLKAHVEASVEFSILLSGYIVKVGVLGLHRTLTMAEEPLAGLLVVGLATVGLFDASFRLPAQRDVKRVVALTTVIEMNWAVLALGLGGGQQVSVAGYLCLAHCFTTTTEFFLVEVLTKRYGTRDLAYLGGLALNAPLLWVVSVMGVLVTIGFPGTSLFWAKYIFFTSLVTTLPGLAASLGFLFLVVLPIFFIRLWSLVWFGSRAGGARIYDASFREAAILGTAIGLGFLLGLAPGHLLWAFTPAPL